jgi:hypothetical protein
MANFQQKDDGQRSWRCQRLCAEPHNMTGEAGVDIKNSGYQGGNRFTANDVNMSVGNISRDPYKEPKTSGIKIRGNGCATKGVMARGPMA